MKERTLEVARLEAPDEHVEAEEPSRCVFRGRREAGPKENPATGCPHHHDADSGLRSPAPDHVHWKSFICGEGREGPVATRPIVDSLGESPFPVTQLGLYSNDERGSPRRQH